jgi:hypothetical protein
MKAIMIAVLSGLIGACATPSRFPVATAKANGTTAPEQSAQTSDVVNQSYLKNGYKVVHQNGQLLYCRSEKITGTQFRNTVCRSDAQMRAAEEFRQHAVDEIENAHGGECAVLKC